MGTAPAWEDDEATSSSPPPPRPRSQTKDSCIVDCAYATILRNGELCLAVPPSEAVRRLASLHEAMCDVLQHVDRSYGLPLIVILISKLLHLITTPYYLIVELSESSLRNRIHFFVLQLMWCTFHFCRLMLVVEPCHRTTYQGKRTQELVCRLITHAPPTSLLASRLEMFSRQLMLRSLNYTPMGMCTLDRPLMTSIIGAVTTYLIILIQFQRYNILSDPN